MEVDFLHQQFYPQQVFATACLVLWSFGLGFSSRLFQDILW